MIRVSRAFAWTMWRQHRHGLRFLGICLVALAALSALLTRIQSGWIAYAAPGILTVIVVLLAIPFTVAFAILAYATEGTDILTRESCFPPVLFRLPVRTAWLAAWPIAVGTATLASLWVVVAWFVLQPWASVVSLREETGQVPLWWPALLAAAILAWSQALLWHPFGLPWLRIIAFILLFVTGIALAPILEHRFTEPGLCGLFAGCIVAGWGTAYLGVRRARHGDTPDWSFAERRSGALLLTGCPDRGGHSLRRGERNSGWSFGSAAIRFPS